MTIVHKLITETYYSIVFSSSNRGMIAECNDLLDDFDFEEPGEVYIALRDFDGDFEGIEIWNSDRKDTQSFISAVCDRYGVNRDDVANHNIKLTNI